MDIGVREAALRRGQREAPAVEVADLSVSFGSREVLHGVSATFASNSITALIGPTGCGKTTLLRTVNRLNDMVPGAAVRGRIEIGGRDVYRDVRDVRELRRSVGMLFQRPNPFPQSIFENVAIGLRAHRIVAGREVRSEVEASLRQVGLWDAVKDKLGESPFGLSGGQQQLLCLARTLAVRPDVILLDEPTSSLDPISTRRVEGLLTGLRDHITIVIVTHNLAQAARISDNAVFLYSGRVVEASETTTLFKNPRNELTDEYVNGRMG